MLTNPPIDIAQNQQDAQLRLAAQSRLYSDAKRDQMVRFGAVAGVGASVGAISLFNQGQAIGAVAGILLLFANALLMYRERRRIALAVSIQEEFDCLVLQLPWNDIVVRRRPSRQAIAAAADRYKGGRIENWYPSTVGLPRPLDVAVCQQSNVGWGAPIHRAWAWTIIGAITAFAACQAAAWWALDLGAREGLDALIAPFLAAYWESLEMSRRNFESARAKEECQAQILEDWSAALAGAGLSEDRCRRYQDEIVHIRRQNAQVPDWFDRRLRSKSEHAMRTTAQDMIHQATRAGLVQEVS